MLKYRDAETHINNIEVILLYGVSNQPCMRFILVIELQAIELPDSIQNDRQR